MVTNSLAQLWHLWHPSFRGPRGHTGAATPEGSLTAARHLSLGPGRYSWTTQDSRRQTKRAHRRPVKRRAEAGYSAAKSIRAHWPGWQAGQTGPRKRNPKRSTVHQETAERRPKQAALAQGKKTSEAAERKLRPIAKGTRPHRLRPFCFCERGAGPYPRRRATWVT